MRRNFNRAGSALSVIRRTPWGCPGVWNIFACTLVYTFACTHVYPLYMLTLIQIVQCVHVYPFFTPPNPPTGPADCHQPLPLYRSNIASFFRPRFLSIFSPFWAPFGRPRWSQNRKKTEKMGVQIRRCFSIAFLLNFCTLLDGPNLEKS